MDNDTINSVRIEIEENIDSYGVDVYIRYFVTYACGSCDLDSAYGYNVNPQCSTCDGIGYVKEYTTKIVKGILNQFMNRTGFLDYVNTPINIVPEGESRITCILDDVLVRKGQYESATYFDFCDYVKIYGKYYDVKDTARTGIRDLFIIQTLLSEKRG